jgi:hypothetical protein
VLLNSQKETSASKRPKAPRIDKHPPEENKSAGYPGLQTTVPDSRRETRPIEMDHTINISKPNRPPTKTICTHNKHPQGPPSDCPADSNSSMYWPYKEKRCDNIAESHTCFFFKHIIVLYMYIIYTVGCSSP